MSATLDISNIPIKTVGEPGLILPPEANVFARRAERFDQLAEGHSLGDWLRFLGALSRAQQATLDAFPAVPLPDAGQLSRAREFRMPPLPAQSWPRDTAWQFSLRQMANTLMPAASPAARVQLERLATLPAEQLEALADRVLHTELYGDDTALLPYVAAGLQVYWTGMARKVSPGVTALDVPGVCPCCGFLPVASVVRSDGDVTGLRYLHCALCNTEWNLVRVKCSSCDSTEGISYRELEGDAVRQPGAVRAETCDSCKSYLKIVHQPNGGVDPVADDLATLALDILVDEAGYARSGPNLLLVPGS